MIIHEKIEELNRVNKEVKQKEEELDKVRHKQIELSQNVIPELMENMGQTGLKSDKFDVNIKYRLRPNLPKESEERRTALSWLAENGFADAFTYKVIIHFDDYDSAKEFSDVTAGSYVEQYIHPQTLEALINEQAGINPDFPIDLFNVFEQRQTKLKELH